MDDKSTMAEDQPLDFELCCNRTRSTCPSSCSISNTNSNEYLPPRWSKRRKTIATVASTAADGQDPRVDQQQRSQHPESSCADKRNGLVYIDLIADGCDGKYLTTPPTRSTLVRILDMPQDERHYNIVGTMIMATTTMIPFLPEEVDDGLLSSSTKAIHLAPRFRGLSPRRAL